MRTMRRRTFVKTAMAASILGQAGAEFMPLLAADTAPTMDGDFPGGCCIFDGVREDALGCRPKTPAKISGNMWCWFTARLSGARGRQKIALQWPDDDAELKAKSQYGGNKNFATVLDRVMNVSNNLRRWRPVEDVQLQGQVARFTVEAGPSGAPLYIAAGLPYFADELEELIAECRATPLAKVTEIAQSQGGPAVNAVRIGPASGGERSFYLQGYQHAVEWAGARILSAMIRYLLSDAGRPLRERYVFHIVPVMNVGHLYGKGAVGNFYAISAEGNMNRDWRTFSMPETAGARDYLRRIVANGERLLQAMDLHMGWSSRASSGACLTAGVKGEVPDAMIEVQERFARHVFAQCDYTTEQIWHNKSISGYTFCDWARAELGVPAQTAEFSRHLVWERVQRKWVRITQRHEERLGAQFADALVSFDWKATVPG
jgi:hypothetical protein